MQGQNTRHPPPPAGGGSVLRTAKNGWEIRLGRPWARPMFFFRPPEAPKSALGRVLGSILRETGRQERNKGSRDRFWEPFWLPK